MPQIKRPWLHIPQKVYARSIHCSTAMAERSVQGLQCLVGMQAPRAVYMELKSCK